MFIFTIFSFQSNEIFLKKRVSKKFCFVRRVGQMGQRGETPHHVAQTEKGGVCVAVYSIKGLTKLTKDVPYSTWHVFCYIT